MLPYMDKSGPFARFMVEGKPFIMLAGELHNSSASSLAYMEPIWPRLREFGLNTVLAPVSWELLEPEEGRFDFTLVQGLLDQAGRQGLKLVLLWFGTWKNASSTYVPAWVKLDRTRFFHAVNADGSQNRAISPFCREAREADAAAFTRLMEYLREHDSDRTVLAVQVENESGLLGTARDHSPEARRTYQSPVPDVLLTYLKENHAVLAPWLRERYDAGKQSGTWPEVFGPAAPEIFSACAVAEYIGDIGRRGKAAYPLPLLANAWTVQCPDEPAGRFPSGGPVARVHDIWRYAAPSIDILAPDLYLENFPEECRAYTRISGNPLFIPELRRDKWASASVFYAVGEHRALCVSPFGIDSLAGQERAAGDPDTAVQEVVKAQGQSDASSLSMTYAILSDLHPLLCDGAFSVRGFMQDRLPSHFLPMRDTELQISYPNPLDSGKDPAGGLVIASDADTFLIAGAGFQIAFFPKEYSWTPLEYLDVEEGYWEDGKWVCYRRLNGDEMRLPFPDKPTMRRYRILRDPREE